MRRTQRVCPTGAGFAALLLGSLGSFGTLWSMAGAQTPGLPPVRQLGRRIATTTDSLTSVSGIRALPGGRAIINDQRSGRLILFDSLLSHPVIIADSTPSTRSAYGASFGGIIPYLADSSLFVDGASLSFLVVDPAGKLTRVMSIPRPADVGSLVMPAGGAALDARGRLVYYLTGVRLGPTRQSFGIIGSAPLDPNAPGGSTRDSTWVVRADFETHRIDSAGFVTSPRTRAPTRSVNADGRSVFTYPIDPILVYDDWAVVSDGSIAFVRGLDYHIDWVNADGSRVSTPRMAHDWHFLSDSEKAAIVDSVQDVYAKRQAHGDSLARNQPNMSVSRFEIPSAAELPSYVAPFTKGAVMADAEDHLWIRQGSTPPPLAAADRTPPATYDIVNRQGQVIDRVQLPPSLTLAGFGRGVVYLTSREATGVVVVEYAVR